MNSARLWKLAITLFAIVYLAYLYFVGGKAVAYAFILAGAIWMITVWVIDRLIFKRSH